MRWFEVVDFKIGPCPLWNGPTLPSFFFGSIVFFDFLLTLLKTCSVFGYSLADFLKE